MCKNLREIRVVEHAIRNDQHLLETSNDFIAGCIYGKDGTVINPKIVSYVMARVALGATRQWR